MIQRTSNKEVTSTQLPQRETKPTVIDETNTVIEVEYGESLKREVQRKIGVRLSHAIASETEALETKLPVVGVGESLRDDDARRNQRARANALMDLECLGFLELFNRRRILQAEELSEYIKQAKDWLKLSLLIRADYLETLDSSIRITPEGLSAWRKLEQFKGLRDRTG
jgi:hypothetical protein